MPGCWTRPLSEALPPALAVWERASLRSPFQHPRFVQSVAERFGRTPIVTGVGDPGDPEALQIGYVSRRGPIRALVLPHHVPVSAPLLPSLPTEAEVHARQSALDELVAGLTARYTQATLRLPVGWDDARPFTWAGWRSDVLYTHLVDVSPDRESTAAWSRRSRRTVRAERDRFRLERGPDTIGDVARWQIASLESQGVAPPADARQLEGLLRAMDAVGQLRSYRVRDESDAVCGAGAFAVDRQQALFWIAGSAPGASMMVLLAHAFADLAQHGVRTIDLGGANLSSIAEFKRRLGGRLTPQLRVQHAGPRWWRVLQAARLS